MQALLKIPLCKCKMVVFTLLCNSIDRTEVAYILLCSVHSVDRQIEQARKENGFRNFEDVLTYCVRHAIVKTLTEHECLHYIALAQSNMKQKLKREQGTKIDWEKFYKELYPDGKLK